MAHTGPSTLETKAEIAFVKVGIPGHPGQYSNSQSEAKTARKEGRERRRGGKREGKGREGKGREGKGREGKGREGSIPEVQAENLLVLAQPRKRREVSRTERDIDKTW